MKRLVTIVTLWLMISVSVGAEQIKVLIIDGINNHNWKLTTASTKATLEHTGRFTVDVSTSYESLSSRLAEHHPELASDAKAVMAAIDGYVGWIAANKHKMTVKVGIGKENYNWLLENVYLSPYTWEDFRMIVELEDNRVIAFQKLEENRNRNLPVLKPAASREEYKERVYEQAAYRTVRALSDL